MIRVGGKEIPWREGMTVAEVLRECGDSHDSPVVRIGEHFVSRPNFERTPVPDGAEILLIPLIAGG
jgi:thiamine biosynthesis protein ThiS